MRELLGFQVSERAEPGSLDVTVSLRIADHNALNGALAPCIEPWQSARGAGLRLPLVA